MIDLASIRNASFSLTPTGYNPEEVDHFLVTLADSQPGSIDLSAVRNASFTLTPTGYNPEEVDHFLGSIADQLGSASAPQDAPAFETAPTGEQEHHDEAPAAEADGAAAQISEEVAAPQFQEQQAERADHHVDAEPDTAHAYATAGWEEQQQAFEHDAPSDEDDQAPAGFHAEQPQAADEWAVPAVAESEPAPEHDDSEQAEQAVAQPLGEPPVAVLPEAVVVERKPADLHGLSDAVDRAIAALDHFVGNELHTVREASDLEMEDIHAERRRLIDEAAEAGRRHIDDARRHADGIIAQAHRETDEQRARFEHELQEERERFEQALADRDAQAQARVAEVLAEAEARRREADELVASAAQAQATMLASFEQARASLIQAAERTRLNPGAEIFSPEHEDADEHDASAAA